MSLLLCNTDFLGPLTLQVVRPRGQSLNLLGEFTVRIEASS